MSWSAVTANGSHLEVDGVKVGFALSPALDADQASRFEFRDQLRHAHSAHAHVLGQSILPGKAGVIVPGVAEEHRVGNFGSDGKVRVFEDEIGDLGKTVPQHGIDRVQLQILFLEDFPN